MSLEINFPWPHRVLWPNGRTRSKAYENRLKKQARHDAHWLTKAAVQRLGRKPCFETRSGAGVPVELVVCRPPKTKMPDKDNCVAVIKPYLDGMCDALGIDDRHFDAPAVFVSEARTGTLTIRLIES